MEWYIFYKFDTAKNLLRNKYTSNSYNYEIWKPKGLNIWPKGFLKYLKEMRSIPIVNLTFWWLIYRIIKRNNEYSILLIRSNQQIIHYTVILPKNYRFPFAEQNDLILGPVWTSPDYRRKGLVYYSLSIILDAFKDKRRNLWWISNEKNKGSRISIEKAGFSYYGKGKIVNDNKLKVFSYFQVQE